MAGGYVVIKKPGEEAKIQEVATKTVDWKFIRDVVEGPIDRRTIGETDVSHIKIDMWLNDEGLLIGMKPNLDLLYYGIIVGPLMFCYVDTRTGESLPLTSRLEAMQLVSQVMQFSLADPDSVKAPEPHIQFIPFTDWTDIDTTVEEELSEALGDDFEDEDLGDDFDLETEEEEPKDE